ncbi:MAG: hypothetical protein UMV23_01740 [Halanaerobium sp.]|nr:hypothetical protein [Halanaerobium sp.]
METQKRKAFTLGGFLVALGIYFLLQNLNIIPDDYFLAFLSLGFLIVYFLGNRNLGFLIPGLIILAVFSHAEWGWEVGQAIGQQEDGLFFIFLGTAFVLIYLIHYLPQRNSKEGGEYWPLYPGIALMGFGLVITYDLFEQIPWNALETIGQWWPLILIAIGVGILVGPTQKGKKKDE